MKIFGLPSRGLWIWIPSLALEIWKIKKIGSICTNGPEIGGILTSLVLKMQLLVLICWWGALGKWASAWNSPVQGKTGVFWSCNDCFLLFYCRCSYYSYCKVLAGLMFIIWCVF